MQTIVSAEEMRWCDESAIRSYGILALLLMENAGRGVAQLTEHKFGPLAGRQILIFCGKGNNGGDGFVAARHLHNSGARVTVVLLADPREIKGDAKTNYHILRRLLKNGAESLSIETYNKRVLKSFSKPTVIIDALFGTGFTGSVREPYAEAIDWINRQSVPVVAVDVPSGVNGTTGVVEHAAVRATVTITFGLIKTGLLCNQARDHVGEVRVIDIGIPNVVRHSAKLTTYLVGGEDVRSRLPRRKSAAHKYNVGKVFILAGSKGYTGAAALCVSAALRAGAGAVVLGTPESVYPILARKLTEAIVLPLPATPAGSLASDGIETIRERMSWADVVAIGPGISLNSETQALIARLLKEESGKYVLDADALQLVREIGLKKLKVLKGDFVLTPHSGEFARIVNTSSKQVDVERVQSARQGARASGATIVLKGAPTVTATSDGRAFVNPTGNPGMATVGSGDVLTGIIASLWAQGMEKAEAAYSGTFLHGLSGDLAKDRVGERSLVAHDLIDSLPQAYQRLGMEGSY